MDDKLKINNLRQDLIDSNLRIFINILRSKYSHKKEVKRLK